MAMTTFEMAWASLQIWQDQEGIRNDMLTNAATYVSSGGAQGANIAQIIAVCQGNAAAYQVRLARESAIPSATRTALLTFMNNWNTGSGLGSDMVSNFNALQAEATLQVSGAAALTDGPSVIAFGNAIIARLPAHFRLW